MRILLVNYDTQIDPLRILDASEGSFVSILSRSKRTRFFQLKRDKVQYEKMFPFNEVRPVSLKWILQHPQRYKFHLFQRQPDASFKELLVA